MNYYVNFLGRLGSNIMAIEKIKILGGVSELPAKQHCQFSPCSIAMGADYSFEVKNIEIWVSAFFKHNDSSVATVLIELRGKNK